VLVSIFFGFFVVEIVLRISQSDEGWQKVLEADILRNFTFEYKLNDLYESENSTVTYVRNEFGLRDNCGVPAEIDILTVGGSTTDQRYVNLDDTYQSVLGANISQFVLKDVCVSNAGIDGQSTYGHIFSFDYWFPLIPNLQPDYILLYIGVNDANFAKENDSTLKELLKSLYLVKKLLPLYRFLRDGADNQGVAYSGHYSMRYTPNDYTISVLNQNTRALSAVNAEAFRMRLTAILERIEAMDSHPICVTQPHQYVRNFDGDIRGIPKIIDNEYSGLDYDYSIRELNSVVRELCGNNLIDLYSENFDAGLFYDGTHTTNVGSQFIGKAIFEQMRQKGFLSIYQ